MNKFEQQTIALAGVYQAAALVDSLARSGQADSDAMEKSLYSVFQTDADTTAEIFSGLDGVHYGLQNLQQQLTSPAREQIGTTRYSISVLLLSGKLLKNPEKLNLISQGIKAAAAKLDLYDYTHSNQIATLADIYSSTISDLSPRIMVKGDPLHLQNPETRNRVRALLLAGIRAAILWRQLGGSRIQLLFKRKLLVKTAKQLLEQSS
ncbi:MAG: high frequency lysogenization protein HflD [Gammaproteobacteria bacterium]|nr:high frequency lysogenization protein HflD [Gammaproteobacteria bacterium]